MRHIDPRSDLQDGVESAPAPDRRPDGTVIIPAIRGQVPPRPSLCRAGPCRNYHRFATQVDAANPRAVRLPTVSPAGPPGTVQPPHGALYQAPAVFHVEVHHYCYPTVGVEMNLGALPVTDCNRWDPDVPGGTLGGRRHLFAQSQDGQEFATEVKGWEATQAAEAAEAAEAESLMAGVLEDASARRACQFCGHGFPPTEIDDSGSCPGCAALNRRESTPGKDPTP